MESVLQSRKAAQGTDVHAAVQSDSPFMPRLMPRQGTTKRDRYDKACERLEHERGIPRPLEDGVRYVWRVYCARGTNAVMHPERFIIWVAKSARNFQTRTNA